MCRAMHTLIPLLIVGLSFGFGSLSAEQFPSQCSFPKAAAGKQQKVDRQCGLAGMGDTPAHKAQNTAKNNFCAHGAAVTLSRDDFKGFRPPLRAQECGLEIVKTFLRTAMSSEQLCVCQTIPKSVRVHSSGTSGF
jgi:hypothetical protein